jgi:predicted esterase
MLIRTLSVFLLFVTLFPRAYGQDECVNYDNRYPITAGDRTHFWNPLWNFPNMKQKKVTQNIGTTGFFQGYLRYLPPSYSQPANAAKNYPVIIFFHGGASRGNGSSLELCRLFKDRGSDSATHLSIPGRVERNTEMFTQTISGVTEEFIVISPQFNKYVRLLPGVPDDFPSAKEVEDVINFVENNFRIDKRKIYLTGYSNGANMIVEYAASSVARAKRVAGIMPVSLCSQADHINNTSRGIDAKHIAQAKLATWFVHCEGDNCGNGPALNVPNKWVEAIMAVDGAVKPRYTRLRNLNPPTLYNCSDSLFHDAWSRAFDPNFKASFNYTPGGAVGANDGINQNMYQWFASKSNAVLPVTLRKYFARLVDRRVQLKWVTTDEENNAGFLIERAGPDSRYIEIGSVPGVKDHTGEKEYSFIDESPLRDINYYRLVQVDVDGAKTYFEVRKVLNRADDEHGVIISPNPFKGDISAFVNLDKSQRVAITLTDMSGKLLKSSAGIYSIGSSEVKINTTNLPAGVYILKITGESVNSTTRVVKR